MKRHFKKRVAAALVIGLFGQLPSAFAAAEVRRTAIRVENAVCRSCLSAIAAKLRGLDGALGMSEALDLQLVLVDHSPSLAEERIAQAITEVGYPAAVVGSAPAPAAGSQFTLEPAGGGCCPTPRSCGLTSSRWEELASWLRSK